MGAKQQYFKLATTRDIYLNRARDCSKITIPTLIPPAGSSAATRYYTPYQSLGSRGVNNLASKLLLSLFPPNTPFFRLSPEPKAVAELELQVNDSLKAEIEASLSQIEQEITRNIENRADRVSLFEAIKHLIVGGNVLIYRPPSGNLKVYHLSRYVVRRDPEGKALQIIAHDVTHPDALSPEVIEMANISTVDPQSEVDIFTILERRPDGKWDTRQEINDIILPDSTGTYKADECPWVALRWTKVDNEDYGRGFVEEYYGDLLSLEGLSKAIVEGSAAAAKVLFMVAPNGTTRKSSIAKAENGDIITGNVQDVSVLQMEKFNDFRVALETIGTISERLSHAFLLNTGVTRNAERVTAEEIRYQAKELEDALGGVYSILSQELQLPYVRVVMAQMTKTGDLPRLPDGLINPQILTGLEALGRGQDLNKLNLFLTQLQPLGPEVLAQYMKIDEYITRVGTSIGLDIKGLIKTPEELQQEAQAQQQALQQQQMMSMAPEVIKQGGQMMQKQMDKEG